MSNNLIAFSISLFIGSAIVMAALFWKNLKDTEKGLEGAARAQLETYKGLIKGLLVLAALPLIFMYLAVSMINQGVRRVLVSCCKCNYYTDEEREYKGWYTKAVADQIENFKTWDHSSVLTYAVYWGFGYVFFNVLASKFTTLFLSWLIERTSTMDLLAVTAIVTGVGMMLFMLPPIPGIPVYLATGIVVVSVGQTSVGLWWSISYACFVSLMIKLLGCLVQQVRSSLSARSDKLVVHLMQNFVAGPNRKLSVSCSASRQVFVKWSVSTPRVFELCVSYFPIQISLRTRSTYSSEDLIGQSPCFVASWAWIPGLSCSEHCQW